MTALAQVLLAIGSAVFAAGGAYAAVRIEIKYLWREVNRIDNVATDAHRRINDRRKIQ